MKNHTFLSLSAQVEPVLSWKREEGVVPPTVTVDSNESGISVNIPDYHGYVHATSTLSVEDVKSIIYMLKKAVRHQKELTPTATTYSGVASCTDL